MKQNIFVQIAIVLCVLAKIFSSSKRLKGSKNPCGCRDNQKCREGRCYLAPGEVCKSPFDCIYNKCEKNWFFSSEKTCTGLKKHKK